MEPTDSIGSAYTKGLRSEWHTFRQLALGHGLGRRERNGARARAVILEYGVALNGSEEDLHMQCSGVAEFQCTRSETMARNRLYIRYLSSKRQNVLANMVSASVRRIENDAEEQDSSVDEGQDMPDPIAIAESSLPSRKRPSSKSWTLDSMQE